MLDEKFSQQNEEISDLKYELCQAEDEKDEAVKSAIDQQKEEFSTLKTTIVELETQLKELQATSTNENIEAIRDKLASQNIELASLRVELKRAEGDKQTANKKAHAEIDMERAQVILLLIHSMARANLKKKLLNFYYHSIKVHTQEAQNLHQLKSPLSDPNLHLVNVHL